MNKIIIIDMKAETFFGVFITVAATFILIMGHCDTVIWKYELLSWGTGALFVLLYNLEIFRPDSPKFNFVISYVGLVTAVFLGQYMMTNSLPIIITVLIVTPIILCLMTAYVPKIAHQFAYRTANHPIFPCKTILLFSWAVIEMAIIF